MKKIETFCPEEAMKRGVKRATNTTASSLAFFFNGMLLCGEKSNAISLSLSFISFSFSLSVFRRVVFHPLTSQTSRAVTSRLLRRSSSSSSSSSSSFSSFSPVRSRPSRPSFPPWSSSSFSSSFSSSSLSLSVRPCSLFARA